VHINTISIAILSVAISACGGDGGPVDPAGDSDSGTMSTDTATTLVTTPLETWQVTGQTGNITLIEHEAGYGSTPRVEVAAAFGDNLPAVRASGQCTVDEALCFAELPDGPDAFVDRPPFELDRTTVDFSWVGYEIRVGAAPVPLRIGHEEDVLLYDDTLRALPGEPGELVGVELGGEWGDYVGLADLEVPSPTGLLGPVSTEYLVLTSPVIFTWQTGLPGEIYLHARRTNGGYDRIFNLEDDGEFIFDPADFGAFDDEEFAEFAFLRWHEREVDVHGNTLTTVGVSMTLFTGGTAVPSTCKKYKDASPARQSSWYELHPVAGEWPSKVWCDMETDGGGWTLVGSTRDVPLQDKAADWHDGMMTLFPTDYRPGIWDGLRDYAAQADVRFACKAEPTTAEMTVDMSFYDVHWYDEFTTGSDADSCFSENNGEGADDPPARRNNLTGDFLPAGDPWNDDGYLEGEDRCSDDNDFTIDFDDRGMNGDQSDGTDWGEDDGTAKCGESGLNRGSWFLYVREAE